MLMETLKAAEGSNDVDEDMMLRLEDEPAPADMELSSPSADAYVFGVPEPDDPDPFGVLALEKEGFEIREAGSGTRPPSTQFEFNPSPTSPVYSKFHRRSMDTIGTRSNRESYMSTRSVITRASIDRGTQTEIGTQTDDHITPITSPSISDRSKRIIEEDEKDTTNEPTEIDYTKIDLGPYSNLNASQELDGSTANGTPRDRAHSSANHSTADTTDTDDDEEPVVFEAASALTPQAGLAIKARGGLVDIPKRPPPPPLPPRNGARSSAILMVDQASGRSPMKSEFEEVDLHGTSRPSIESRRSRLSVDTEVETRDAVVEKELETAKPDADDSLVEKVEQHLDIVASDVEHSSDVEKVAVVENESANATPNGNSDATSNGNGLLQVKSEAEEESFHSVPTSPMEVVEVK